MFLKSLEVKGFKSFAEKTDLEFKEGITAVVGPNGSGKSNVSDAVKWVLGEQSVKSLRGGKMEDVIFAGTQFRKPVGLAQVSITLDNIKGELPVEYSEVKVTRKIFRSGESEYLINNQKCRLKDITELFMDTGIGKEGYSLIGQGKIDAILSGKPEERRTLFEEAAGIVKYKARKEEAEKKLGNTDNNLIRIRDIISTYEERLEPLKKEKEKALIYKKLEEELKTKEVSIIVKTLKELDRSINDISNIISKNENILFEKKDKIDGYKKELLILEGKIEELENKSKDEKENFYNKKEFINKNINDIELFKERISNFKELNTKEKIEIEDLNTKLEFLYKEKEYINNEIESKEEDFNKKNKEIKILNDEIDNLHGNIKNIDDELQKLKNKEFEFITNKSELSNSINVLNRDIDINKSRQKELKKILLVYSKDIDRNKSEYDDLNKKINITNLDIKKLEEENIISRGNIKKSYDELNQNEINFNLENKKINELEATYLALSNLEKNYEGYNKTVKTLMEKIKKGELNKVGNIKVLGEIIEITKQYETAIEISLGAAISNVITETDEEAKRIINYLKEKKIGRATFLPLNIIRGKKIQVPQNIIDSKGYIGIASELVSVSKGYENIIDYSLGRIIITDNMDSAMNISKISNHIYKIVTLTGEVINPGGSLTGGSIQGRNSNLLGRKRELDEIEINIKRNKESLELVINKINTIKDTIQNINNSINESKDEINNKKIFLAKTENEIKNILNEKKSINKFIMEFTEEENILKSQESKLKINLETKEIELGKIGEINFKSKEKIKFFEEALDENRIQLDNNKEKLTDIMIYTATLEEGIQGKRNELISKQKTIEEKENNRKTFEIEIENKKNAICNLEVEIKNKNEKIENLKLEIDTLENSFKEDDINKIKYKDIIKEKNVSINELVDILRTVELEINKREVLKAKLESDKEAIYRRLNEELALTLAEAEDISIEIVDSKKVKDEIQKIKNKISLLGIINLTSIVEYDEVLEKYEFMSSQELDLEQAKNELINLIEEMTTKMQNIFTENFKVLNKNFGETFKKLFKGGSGELILGEGDELSANIIINVQPPGKKLQNINLMSGGEKVLSAIALLFAILKMKPTPFCILDEIEAALDDANVFRYAEFLKEFSENIQFIVITHRKGTMEASDVMYGITMEEKGVSKVVSVDLSKN